MKRENHITVRLGDDELAVLDEHRGAVPRAVYLRRLLHEPTNESDIATRSEALSILSSMARDGKAQPAIALARELREGGERDVVDWILDG